MKERVGEELFAGRLGTARPDQIVLDVEGDITERAGDQERRATRSHFSCGSRSLTIAASSLGAIMAQPWLVLSDTARRGLPARSRAFASEACGHASATLCVSFAEMARHVCDSAPDADGLPCRAWLLGGASMVRFPCPAYSCTFAGEPPTDAVHCVLLPCMASMVSSPTPPLKTLEFKPRRC